MKIISIILTLVSVFLSIKHGWDTLQPSNTEQAKMMMNLGIAKAAMPFLGVFSILLGILLLFQQTFVISNILNAITIVLIMALSLRADDAKTALIEIPFLAMSLLLIWLKYPFIVN